MTLEKHANSFDPSLGRDDSSTILLYRFIRGLPITLPDLSTRQPPVNAYMPVSTSMRWQPTQGRTIKGAAPIYTPEPADKLLGIAETQACTFEFWISGDPVTTPASAHACWLTWGLNANERNVAIGHSESSVLFIPQGTPMDADNPEVVASRGYRPGLQYYALTWDGTTTRLYHRGRLTGEATVAWGTERWVAGRSLMLGNQADGNKIFFGTYYLLAIHDRCLDHELIQRHYKAGPTAPSQ